METKKNRTMEVYAEAGAYMMLFSAIGFRTIRALEKILPHKETDKLMHMINRYDLKLSDKADRQMCKDHYSIYHDCNHIFYGYRGDYTMMKGAIDKMALCTAKAKIMELEEKLYKCNVEELKTEVEA